MVHPRASRSTLCGHATLADAHTLYENRTRGSVWVTFHTKSVTPHPAPAKGDRIEMDFPAAPPTPVATPPGLLDALGITDAVAVLDNKQWYIVEVADPAVVEGLTPDLRRLEAIVAGASVTARSDRDGVDIVSRVFGPGVGVDEDAVTG